jgi:hypothetical protein
MKLKNRIILVMIGLVIIFLFFPRKAMAEEVTSYKAKIYTVYQITDAIKKEKKREEWEATLVEEKDTKYLTINKKDFVTKELTSFSIEDSEQKRTQTIGQNFYLKEFFATHPAALLDEGTVFGRIEILDLEKHTLVNSWPMFGEVITRDGISVLTLRVIIPFMGTILTTRIYRKENYYIPLFERQQFFTKEGALKEDLLYTKEETEE